jgi:hypothetical protein
MNTVTTFRFASFNPDILNCVLQGSDSQTVVQISTDSNGYTLFKGADKRPFATIAWGTGPSSSPTVQIKGVINEQSVANFLKLNGAKT